MKLHYVLYTLGALFTLSAWLTQQFYTEKKGEASKIERGRELGNYNDRLVARVAEATNPSGQIEIIESELADRGVSKSAPSQAPGVSTSADLDHQIAEAIREIPKAVRENQHVKMRALMDESRAQEFARQIDAEFRPQIASIVDLMRNVLIKTGAEGLLPLRAEPSNPVIPDLIAYTTYTMERNGITATQPLEGGVFRFDNGAEWNVSLTLGMVRSPAVLAKSWNAPTEKYYPMLRIEETLGTTQKQLGVIWYHQDTKVLGFEFSARDQVRPQTREAIERLAREKVGGEMIASVLVELAKRLRLEANDRSAL